jgi:hypothetical protein
MNENIETDKAELEALQADLKKKEADFAERENAIKAREAELVRKDHESFVEKMVEDGKVLPAMKERMINFMCGLNDDTVVEFSEGDKKVEQGSVEAFKAMIESNKPVDFKERAPEDRHGEGSDTIDATQVAKEAANFRESELAAGRTVSTAQAVEHIIKTKAQA